MPEASMHQQVLSRLGYTGLHFVPSTAVHLGIRHCFRDSCLKKAVVVGNLCPHFALTSRSNHGRSDIQDQGYYTSRADVTLIREPRPL
jgi:hypothetical protein